MELGAFSLSLAVKDIAASKAFYETLGFAEFAGTGLASFTLLDPAGNPVLVDQHV